MQPGGRSYAVLIESDWNLKQIQASMDRLEGAPVLIESDWNLKDLTDNLCLPSH